VWTLQAPGVTFNDGAFPEMTSATFTIPGGPVVYGGQNPLTSFDITTMMGGNTPAILGFHYTPLDSTAYYIPDYGVFPPSATLPGLDFVHFQSNNFATDFRYLDLIFGPTTGGGILQSAGTVPVNLGTFPCGGSGESGLTTTGSTDCRIVAVSGFFTGTTGSGPPPPLPEPATLSLLATGLIGVVAIRRQTKS
jgi:hypothetical protein